jgi:chromosome partitioning protein
VLGKKVLLVDADPQANATSGLGFDINGANLYDCIVGRKNAAEVIVKSENVKNLWLLPSSIDLVAADTELPVMDDGHYVVKKILQSVAGDYDYVFVDCSPSLGFTTVNVLIAADSVLIPVQCEYFALEGLSKLLATIKKTREKLNPALQIEGFVLTMYGHNKLSNQVVSEVKKHFESLVFDTIVARNIRLSEAPGYGKPVVLYDAAASGSVNYLNLAKEFIKRNKKA